MGGLGSGRQWGCGKATVEDSFTLDINKLIRDGNVRPGQWCSGSLRWTRVASGEEVGSIGYEANLTAPDQAWVRLHYRVNDEPQDYRVTLETTRPNYGAGGDGGSVARQQAGASPNCICRPVGRFSQAEELTA